VAPEVPVPPLPHAAAAKVNASTAIGGPKRRRVIVT
jgi:hypothetical protein